MQIPAFHHWEGKLSVINGSLGRGRSRGFSFFLALRRNNIQVVRVQNLWILSEKCGKQVNEAVVPREISLHCWLRHYLFFTHSSLLIMWANLVGFGVPLCLCPGPFSGVCFVLLRFPQSWNRKLTFVSSSLSLCYYCRNVLGYQLAQPEVQGGALCPCFLVMPRGSETKAGWWFFVLLLHGFPPHLIMKMFKHAAKLETPVMGAHHLDSTMTILQHWLQGISIHLHFLPLIFLIFHAALQSYSPVPHPLSIQHAFG